MKFEWSRTATLRLLAALVIIFVTLAVNDAVVLLPLPMLSAREQRLITAATDVCAHESYTACHGLDSISCKIQMESAARHCLRAADRDHEPAASASADSSYAEEFAACVVGRHYADQTGAGLEGARCAGEAYLQAVRARPRACAL